MIERVDQKQLLDAMGNGVLLLDNNDVITHVNQKIEELTGYQTNELIGKSVAVLIESNDNQTLLKPKKNNFQEVLISEHQLYNEKQAAGRMVIVQNTLELEQQIIKKKNQSLAVINQFMIEQTEVDQYEVLVELVTEQLSKFLNAIITIYNEYDEQEKNLIVKDIQANSQIIEMAKKMLGEKIEGLKMPITDKMYQQIIAEKIKKTDSLYESSLKAVPKPVSYTLGKTLGINSILAVAYTLEDKLYGTTSIVLKEDIEDYVLELLRVYAHFTAVSLKRIKIGHQLKTSEAQFRNFFENMIVGGAIHEMLFDENGKPYDYRFLDINERFKKLTGLNEEIIGKTVKEVLPGTEDHWIKTYGSVVKSNYPINYENHSKELNKDFDVSAFPLKDNHFATIFVDVTNEKAFQQKIEYLSFHDNLTGLKNRHYYEIIEKSFQEDECHPLGVAVVDLNGLKLLNDTYGHKAGDRTLKCSGEVLTEACQKQDVIIRWGGDEFIIFCPNTSEQEMQFLSQEILAIAQGKCHQCEQRIPNYTLSLAMGTAIKDSPANDLETIIMTAENQMYRHKLTESKSARNAIINAFLETLKTKKFEKSHITRMLEMAQPFSEELSLTSEQKNDLDLLINLHDIGKINIKESIITKRESLTDEEWLEIKQHPEIGYRIAKATEDFAHVANDILSHHERWDGQGYPQGLKGYQIPSLARVLNILDAWEVMSGGRPYKEKMSDEDIIEEFEKCGGSQFDPALTEAFVNILQKQKTLKKI